MLTQSLCLITYLELKMIRSIGEILNDFMKELEKKRNEAIKQSNNQFGLDKMLNPQNK